MSKRKKIITEAARTLFNEKGYHNVTIRMIALKLNMSSGNLTYHFQKREDIFEALYFEMVSEFDQRIKDIEKVEVSVTQIRNDIRQSMNRMLVYKFFWTDLYSLLAVSEKVKAHFQEVYEYRFEGCMMLFEKLKKQDLMRDPSFKSEYDFLAERMIHYGNTWLYATELYLHKRSLNMVDDHVHILLSMLHPFLTAKGQKEFKNELPEVFG